MVLVEEGVSLKEVDEALTHVAASLKVDRYGNRMSWSKRDLFLQSIDDLLDERILLSAKELI